jgi:hypothetical protein
MKRYLATAAVLASLTAMMLVLALSAGASSEKRFVLGLNGTFTSDTTAAGAFTVAGALSDSGTAALSFTVVSQRGNCYVLTGDNTFTALDGSFTLHVSGTNCFSSLPDPNDPRAIFDGRFVVASGTGAFRGLSGRGTLTGENDLGGAGTFTSVYDGTANLRH